MQAGAKTRRRGPRKATPDYLHRSALNYLARYATSRSHLERILINKVERSAEAHGTDRREGSAAVEQILDKMQRIGLLDDAAFAESRAAVLFRRGASPRAIRAALALKGVAREKVDEALALLAEDAADLGLAAALTYARRRRLGPYRASAERAAQRERDLAALGRRGFDYDVACRVIDAADPDALERVATVGEER